MTAAADVFVVSMTAAADVFVVSEQLLLAPYRRLTTTTTDKTHHITV